MAWVILFTKNVILDLAIGQDRNHCKCVLVPNDHDDHSVLERRVKGIELDAVR